MNNNLQHKITPNYPRKALLILWDDDIKEHRNLNCAIARMLNEKYKLTIINYPEYIRSKRAIKERYIDSSEKNQGKSLDKTIKKIVSAAKTNQVLRTLFGKTHLINSNSGSPNWPQESNFRHGKRVTIKKVLTEIRQHIWKHNTDNKISSLSDMHALIDLSLDAKLQEDQINTTEEKIIVSQIKQNLRKHAEHISNMVSDILKGDDPTNWIVFNTNVYSLDWITRQIVLSLGCEHRFIENEPISREDGLRVKIYRTYASDLYIRRQIQDNLNITEEIAKEATQYALFYLNQRFFGSTSHTFSPLEGSLESFQKLLERLRKSRKYLWTYFSNSPDELASIEHGIEQSDRADKFKTLNSGVAQTEEEAIKLLGKLAQEYNALLVVRLHPRLGKMKGANRVSSALKSMLKACGEAEQDYPGAIYTITPDMNINSYLLTLLSEKIISFRGTMPLEANLFGIDPIVLAIDKGFANYWIKMHSDLAPKNLDELRMRLLDESITCKDKDLIKFLVEFWVINQLGSIALSQRNQWTSATALISDPEEFYRSELHRLSKNSEEILSDSPISKIARDYRKSCGEVIEELFFGNSIY